MTSRANMNKNNRAYYQRHKEEILTRRKAKREENKKYKEQLTKAKEIIYRLMDIIKHDLKCFDTMAGLDIKQKAEQFIKEIEK